VAGFLVQAESPDPVTSSDRRSPVPVVVRPAVSFCGTVGRPCRNSVPSSCHGLRAVRRRRRTRKTLRAQRLCVTSLWQGLRTLSLSDRRSPVERGRPTVDFCGKVGRSCRNLVPAATRGHSQEYESGTAVGSMARTAATQSRSQFGVSDSTNGTGSSPRRSYPASDTVEMWVTGMSQR